MQESQIRQLERHVEELKTALKAGGVIDTSASDHRSFSAAIVESIQSATGSPGQEGGQEGTDGELP